MEVIRTVKMQREFEIGDYVIHKSLGIIGKVIEFYVASDSVEHTMVRIALNGKYHAPTFEWAKIKE